ncbi:MAG: TerB family tellurite resistance protein [Gemmatimonadaceae bacterium]|nr:TerB family tellurite resistance protein [Gemmatimonadaceae bacterium]
MLDQLRRFIRHRRSVGVAAAPESPHDEIQLAATALLLDLAYADGEFTPDERAHIESALGRHFNLDEPCVNALLTIADRQRREAVDHFHFTRMLNQQLDVGQRVVLAEVMYGVILADGSVRDPESVLLRKLANLLDIAPGYLTEAGKRASEARQAL